MNVPHPRPPMLEAGDSCAVCRRGDTTTGLVFVGEPEWIIAGLIRVGIPDDEARAFAEYTFGLGLDPDVPEGRTTLGVRLCRECAEKTRMPVGDIGPVGDTSKRLLPVATQPDDGGA